jgi:hypothetical protein
MGYLISAVLCLALAFFCFRQRAKAILNDEALKAGIAPCPRCSADVWSEVAHATRLSDGSVVPRNCHKVY